MAAPQLPWEPCQLSDDFTGSGGWAGPAWSPSKGLGNEPSGNGGREAPGGAAWGLGPLLLGAGGPRPHPAPSRRWAGPAQPGCWHGGHMREAASSLSLPLQEVACRPQTGVPVALSDRHTAGPPGALPTLHESQPEWLPTPALQGLLAGAGGRKSLHSVHWPGHLRGGRYVSAPMPGVAMETIAGARVGTPVWVHTGLRAPPRCPHVLCPRAAHTAPGVRVAQPGLTQAWTSGPHGASGSERLSPSPPRIECATLRGVQDVSPNF